MPLDKRSTVILQELINAEKSLSANDLMNSLNVSKRTIYYDLEKVNSWLKEHQLSSFTGSYSKGFYLDPESKHLVRNILEEKGQEQYYYSKTERILLLGVFLILNKQNIHVCNLMDKTDVSRVTIFKDLDELKQDLASFNLTIEFDKRRGYTVSGSESSKRKAIAHYLSRLFSHKGWDQLTIEVQTLLNQKFSGFKEKEAAEKNHALKQKEKQISKYKGVHSLDVSDFHNILLECEDILGLELTDEMMQTLSLNLFIFCKRMQQNLSVHVDPHEKTAIKSTPEYQKAEKLAGIVEERSGLSLPEDEKCFLTMYLLGSKINSISGYKQSKEMLSLKKVLRNMVLDFQKYSCVFFRNPEELEEIMFIHLKPAYYRLKYDVFIENPLSQNIEENYPEVFQISKKVVKHLENLVGKPVNDQETAYIAMHFGGWLRRQGAILKKRYRAVIVCGSGIGTSNFVRFQIEQVLNNVDIVSVISARDYQKNQYEVDLFLSTISIEEKSKPVIQVSPILTDKDKRQLLERVNAMDGLEFKKKPNLSSILSVIQKHTKIINEQMLIQDLHSLLQSIDYIPKESRKPMLNELLTEKTIQFKSNVKDWKKAIAEASEPLLKEDYVTKEYVDAMIESVKALGPYIVIVPHIAIPHARPEQGVKKLGMSLLCLKEPVPFSDKEEHQVFLVIVLAAIDNEMHLQALSQLISLLSDEKKVAKIRSSSSPEEILPLLQDLPVHEN